MNSASGFTDFLTALKRIRTLLVWTVGGSLIIPLAAYEADVSPPWPPKGIILITAIIQLLTSVVFFQLFQYSTKKFISKYMIASCFIFSLIGACYIVATSELAFYGGPAKERLVKGLACTKNALSLPEYAAECPLLPSYLIDTAEKTEELWTPRSITISRLILLILWSILCCSMNATIMIFVVYQSKRKSSFL